MARVEANRSGLTGAELKGILARFRVPVTRFAQHAGIHETTAQEYVSGKHDGRIPLWVEWMLWAYDKDPQMCLVDRDLHLPVKHWLSRPAPGVQGRRGRPPKESMASAAA
jgi:hypothetical protein